MLSGMSLFMPNSINARPRSAGQWKFQGIAIALTIIGLPVIVTLLGNSPATSRTIINGDLVADFSFLQESQVPYPKIQNHGKFLLIIEVSLCHLPLIQLVAFSPAL